MKILLVTVIIFTLNGCSALDNIAKNRDLDYTLGCVLVESGLKLGYFNQAGEAEVFKVKCSDELPKGYCFEYESRTGAKVKVGDCEPDNII